MHHHYSDIRDKIAELPRWFDESAVPRYCDFAPDQVTDIYADEVALVEIACQNCGQRFPVAFSRTKFDFVRNGATVQLAEEIRTGLIHYGDPPNVGCCAAGPTMNCEDLHVIEFWAKGGLTPDQYCGPSDQGAYSVVKDMKYFDWVRVPELEIVLPDGEPTPAGYAPPNQEKA